MIQNRNTMSIHEAAILLDCYLQGQNEKHSKIEMARRASQLLRQMAVNSGKEIDDSYRNIAGIRRA